ncbi:MAG TPA: 5-formyltetrahydrofolate cyclo-ligase [bacterium]|nr:5-formyltetrahydrofolate cyclo-ligase [bacterium]
MEKEVLRKDIRAKRRLLSDAEVSERSRRIIEHIVTSHLFGSATKVALYHPFRNEADLRGMLNDRRKEFYFPRVTAGTRVLDFHRVGSVDELIDGYQGIREPAATAQRCPVAAIDLFLVPGVAFSRAGERIGYGGGYYDATLRERRPGAPAIGVGFDLQIVPEGFSDEYDTAIDGFVTESGMMLTNRK